MPRHPIGRLAVLFGLGCLIAMLVLSYFFGFENIPDGVRAGWMALLVGAGILAAIFDDPPRINDCRRRDW